MRGSDREKLDTRDQAQVAVALGYNPDQESAPRVVATGKGEIARRIVEIAERHGVHIHQDAALAERLSMLELESVIPPELYQIVAELLLFVYRLDDQWKSRYRGGR
jgi:flagellar biosynthesis protein